MPAPVITINSATVQPDHSIDTLSDSEFKPFDAFISTVLLYGYKTGVYSKSITGGSGGQSTMQTVIPIQPSGGTVYMKRRSTYASGVYDSAEVTAVVPTTIPTNYINPTGKQNVLTSFNKWLETNIPPADSRDFSYIFDPQMAATKLPEVEVTEFQYFNPGNSAFGMNLFPASSYPTASPATQGTMAEMMIQINIRADQGIDKNAKRSIYRIRDRVKRGLQLSAMVDDATGNPYVAPMLILDYGNAPPATPPSATGILMRIPVEQDNAIQERYLPPDAGAQNIQTIQLLVRLQWYEMN